MLTGFQIFEALVLQHHAKLWGLPTPTDAESKEGLASFDLDPHTMKNGFRKMKTKSIPSLVSGYHKILPVGQQEV